MKQTAVEWIEGYLLEYNDISNDLRMRKAFEYAKSMEKKQRNTLLKYIEEVRDLCDKLRFPTEEELRELADKADGIFKQFNQQEQ